MIYIFRPLNNFNKIITDVNQIIKEINSSLKKAYFEQNNVSHCDSSAEMKEKYEQALNRAKEMNVPSDVLFQYKSDSQTKIFEQMLKDIEYSGTSKNMKEELVKGLERAKQIGLSQEQIDEYKKKANKIIADQIEREEAEAYLEENKDEINALFSCPKDEKPKPKTGFFKRLFNLFK